MSLRVMTWNLWWRFGPFERRRPAIVAVVRSVDPDVLCLQEVWSDEQHDLAVELADELGMHMVRSDPAWFRGESFGNAILSRWPIERIASLPLPGADGRPGHRRIVAGRVTTPFGPWPVVSTHFDHRFDASATRQLQARVLLGLAADWRGDADTDPPVVVGGDLNALGDSDEVRMLTGRSPGVDGIVFSDVWEQVGVGPGHTWRRDNPYTADSTWPNRRLDYLLVSWPRPKPLGNPIRAWTVADAPVDIDGEPVWPSDHSAVVAELNGHTVPGTV